MATSTRHFPTNLRRSRHSYLVFATIGSPYRALVGATALIQFTTQVSGALLLSRSYLAPPPSPFILSFLTPPRYAMSPLPEIAPFFFPNWAYPDQFLVTLTCRHCNVFRVVHCREMLTFEVSGWVSGGVGMLSMQPSAHRPTECLPFGGLGLRRAPSKLLSGRIQQSQRTFRN